jgi:hypothetical protein
MPPSMAKEGSELLIGPEESEWLKDFSNEFQAIEPQPVRKLPQTA